MGKNCKTDDRKYLKNIIRPKKMKFRLSEVKMSIKKKVFCAATTPMNKKQKIDFDGFKNNIDWYVNEGLTGILVCGGTGEFASLKRQERYKLAEVAVEHINSRVASMICCADETTEGAIEYAKHAKSIGADSLMLTGSWYFAASDEECLEHFRKISEAVDIPMMLYNNPASSGVDLSAEMIHNICKFKNIDSVKEASGNLIKIREIIRISKNSVDVFCGSDEIALEAFLNNAAGWVSITANSLPSQSQMIFDLAREGKILKAKEIFQRFLPLYTLCEQPHKAIQTIKYCMDKQGLAGGYSRSPRLCLTENEKLVVDNVIKEIGLI